MSYMWNEFNIKTFPAETIVYRDGVYCPELSTIGDGGIDKEYDLPIHIIYVGEIIDSNELNIEIKVENQPVFLSVDVKNKKPAFLNIFIKNTGKNSELRGHVFVENFSTLDLNVFAGHFNEKTGILVHTKLIGHADSCSKLTGNAEIGEKCKDCTSDIGFSAILDKNARAEFLPIQHIKSEPKTAEHSASIYRQTPAQIQFLRMAGLSTSEIQNVAFEAFKKDFSLF